ncbi:hypothetical protein WA1_49310 [Scytonema hofmannii PCC 7110]|uniref:Uncharacterized protein n=1 Tax=Scytonema hofmannii PCC 7110 TaxID=128403 RepID=A0A139WQN2_9CYAN|nr:hypothetical protein WA1_49310 [Scytonema hofmannii PCC 7110]
MNINLNSLSPQEKINLRNHLLKRSLVIIWTLVNRGLYSLFLFTVGAGLILYNKWDYNPYIVGYLVAVIPWGGLARKEHKMDFRTGFFFLIASKPVQVGYLLYELLMNIIYGVFVAPLVIYRMVSEFIYNSTILYHLF